MKGRDVDNVRQCMIDGRQPKPNCNKALFMMPITDSIMSCMQLKASVQEPDKSSYHVLACNMRNVLSTFKSII